MSRRAALARLTAWGSSSLPIHICSVALAVAHPAGIAFGAVVAGEIQCTAVDG